ncbi:MAG: trypsin-like serine protease [Candidatus Bilamarchaeaceae archaeon]
MSRKLVISASIFLAICAYVLSCPGSSQITIDGKKEAGPYELIRLELKNAPEDASILWRIYPVNKEDRASTVETVLEFIAPPGEYQVEAIIAYLCNGKPKLAYATTSVKIRGSPQPPPEPGPKPPDPSPSPPQPSPPQPGPGVTIDAFNALGRITFGSSGCTATIIKTPDFPRSDGRVWILTAAHCVSRVGQTGRYVSRDGSLSTEVVVASINRRADCAWLITTSNVTSGRNLKMAIIASSLPQPGVEVWHAGFGVDKPGNVEKGRVTRSEDSSGQTEMILSASSGDSGGGIFRVDNNELISCVCCTVQPGAKMNLYGASVNSIRELFNNTKPPNLFEYSPPDEGPVIWNPMYIPVVPPKRYTD